MLVVAARFSIFNHPVLVRSQFPAYMKFVDQCMDFQTMRTKIEAHSYTTFAQFVDDFHTVCRNCLLFNTP